MSQENVEIVKVLEAAEGYRTGATLMRECARCAFAARQVWGA
jgi:hypothetical protein